MLIMLIFWGNNDPRSLHCIKESRHSKKIALERWLRRFQDRLHPESLQMAQDLLVEISNEPNMEVMPGTEDDVGSAMPAVHGRVIPDIPQCQNIVNMSMERLLAKEIITQHTLPKSVKHDVAASLNWLHGLRLDESLHHGVRNAAELLLCLAPRLLWPMPPRQTGQRLAAHAKPRLVQKRLDMLSSGQWLPLVSLTLCDLEEDNAEEDKPPMPAGLLTRQNVKLVERATKQGRLSVAWRQLWSHGKVVSSHSCAAAMEAKMTGPQLDYVSPVTLLPNEQESLRGLLTDKVLKSIFKGLRPGKAPDSLGWTQAVWAELYSTTVATMGLRRLLEDIWCGAASEKVLAMSMMYRSVGLYKNMNAEIRPICIPSVWRKCTANIACHLWQHPLRKAAGDTQYGTGVSCGVSSMAWDVSLMKECPTWHYLQLDIANVFPSLGKLHVETSMKGIDPLLALSQRWWIHQGCRVMIPCASGQRRLHDQAHGVPQGDPLASWSFAAVLSAAQQDLKAQLEAQGIGPAQYRVFSYLDDIVMAVAPMHARCVSDTWRRVLEAYGLRLQEGKTVVHTLRLVALKLHLKP